MGLFENFPYANFHELNLDWILHELKELETEITNFVAINSVKYANPIVWDITSQYETNTVVLDSSGNAYLSVQPVPAGVALDREEYWTKIGNFSALWDSVRSAITPYDEQHSTTASVDHKPGDWVWLENDLLLITKDMTAGDKYVDGSNCKKTNVHDLFTTLSGELQDEIAARENGDTTLNQQITKEINDRTAVDTELRTELLKAIADAHQNFIDVKKAGAVGDGAADDTEVFKSVFAGGNKTIFIPKGTYKITDEVEMFSNTTVICDGTISDYYDTEKNTYTGLFYARNSENIRILGLAITGHNSGNNIGYKSEIGFENCQDCVVRDAVINTVNATYCILQLSGNGLLIDNAVIDHYSYCGCGNINAGNNFSVINSKITNCDNLTASNTYPITLNAYDSNTGITTMGKNLSAINNYISNEHPFWESIDCHGGTNIVISNNICEHVAYGIACFTDLGRNFKVTNAIISDNIINIDSTASLPKTLYGITAGGNRVTIANNIINNGGQSSNTSTCGGMYINNGEHIVVANNTITNSKADAILVSPDAATENNITICNNTIDGVAAVTGNAGMGIEFKNGNYSECHIDNNTIKNCYYGLRFPSTYTGEAYVKSTGTNFDNVTELYDNETNAITESASNSPEASGLAAVMGRRMDIIMRRPAASTGEIGWICSVPKTANSNSVWISLGRYA